MSHLFSVGDYVNASPASSSNGGIGWVKGLNDNGTCDVQYVVEKKLSREVAPSRVAVAALGTTKRATSTDNDIVLPSLLSPA